MTTFPSAVRCCQDALHRAVEYAVAAAPGSDLDSYAHDQLDLASRYLQEAKQLLTQMQIDKAAGRTA